MELRADLKMRAADGLDMMAAAKDSTMSTPLSRRSSDDQTSRCKADVPDAGLETCWLQCTPTRDDGGVSYYVLTPKIFRQISMLWRVCVLRGCGPCRHMRVPFRPPSIPALVVISGVPTCSPSDVY